MPHRRGPRLQLDHWFVAHQCPQLRREIVNRIRDRAPNSLFDLHPFWGAIRVVLVHRDRPLEQVGVADEHLTNLDDLGLRQLGQEDLLLAEHLVEGFRRALFGRLGVLVVRTQLGFFNAPRLTKCIPLIDQVGNSAAFLSL